mgnify:CR=1 FL=1
MEIVLLRIDSNLSWESCKKYVYLLSDERKEKCNRYINDKDKMISLLSGLLIRKEIGKGKEIKCMYNKYGKPYLKDRDDLYFSISHSGEYIALAYDSKEIGIDIEKIGIFNQKISKKFFTVEENEYIEKSDDKNMASYKIWTSKEAYLKKIGTGFSNGGYKVNILDQNINEHIITKKIDDYMLSVAKSKW